MIYNYFPYVKKEDIPSYIKYRKAVLALIPLSMAIVITVIRLLVFPKIIDLYHDFLVDLPLIADLFFKYSFVAVAVFIVIALYFFTLPIDIDKITEEFKHLPQGELISVKKMNPYKAYEPFLMLLLGIGVGLIVIGVISPIYEMTSRFQ